MGASETIDAVREAVAPALADLGLSLYDVELTGSGRARALRVTIHREGGVDLEAVTAATQAISPLLDEAPISGPFQLEVSSPGVERALRRPEHFRGAAGEVVMVKHTTPDGSVRARGVLLGADGEGVVLDVDGEEQRIAYHDITTARTVFEWGPAPRPGARHGSRPGQGSRGRSEERSRS